MRKVVFGGANSLDNYFARKDDSVDWLMWSDDVSKLLKDYWKRFDTIIMGRKTYEVALRMSKGSGGYPGMKNYVFSRTLKKNSDRTVTVVSEDAADFVRKLKEEDGKDICVMGGGLLANALFEADVIDEIGFNIHPVLLGSGIPMFHEMNHQIDLELIKVQQFKTGCVLVEYRVLKPGEKRSPLEKAKKRSTKKTRKSATTGKSARKATKSR